jgi:hypothetical protein
MPKKKAIVQDGKIWDNQLGRYRDRTGWDPPINLSAKELFESYIAPRCNCKGYQKEERWPRPSLPTNPLIVAQWVADGLQADDTFIVFLELYVKDRTVARAIFDLTFNVTKGKFPWMSIERQNDTAWVAWAAAQVGGKNAKDGQVSDESLH